MSGEPIETRVDEPFIARAEKWKILLLIALDAAFVAAGLWVAGIYGPPPLPYLAWLGWLAVMLFSVLGVLIGRRLFGDNLHVRIGDNGVYYRQWSGATIPWSEVSEVGIWEGRLVLTLRDPSLYPPKTTLGRFAKANKELIGGDVVVDFTDTDGSIDEVMAAVERYWPTKRSIAALV